MPMIKVVYYFPPHNMQPGTETLLRSATLLGAMVGQITFGFLAGQSNLSIIMLETRRRPALKKDVLGAVSHARPPRLPNSGNAHANSMLDLYGRRKMYGIELYIIIGAIIGILMSSSGEAHSLDMFNSLFAWRFVMGIGKRS